MRALQFLIVLLAGCASEPGQDRIRADYTLDLAPHQAVRCLARNAERYDGSLKAQIHETETLVTEVRVEQAGATLAVAYVAPARGGSVVTIWQTSSGSLDARFPGAMAEGC